MSHMFESGFFTRKEAWHGLGSCVQENLRPLEAFQKSGLNWRVNKCPLYAVTPLEMYAQTPFFGIVREKDDRCFGVVKKNWTPFQNEEAFEWAVPFCESGLWTFETAGALWEGRRCWMLLKQGESEIVPGDTLRNYLLAFWSHDGLSANFVTLTSVRVVCWNTLQQALRNGLERHTARHDSLIRLRMDEIRELYLETGQKFKEQQELFRALAARKLDRGEQVRIIKEELFPVGEKQGKELSIALNNQKALEEALDRASGAEELGVRDTAYGFLMAVSEASEHFLGGDRVKDRGANILWGTGAALVNKAERALQVLS